MTVIKVTNATVRGHIENFTNQYTFPHVIKFIRDGSSSWVTSLENFENIRYTGIRSDLKEYFATNGIQTNVRSLKEALEQWGELIQHTP